MQENNVNTPHSIINVLLFKRSVSDHRLYNGIKLLYT